MSYSKTQIYNLALSHLLLSRQIDETETDTITNEVRVLNTFWDSAFNVSIQEMDLNSMTEEVQLELIEKLEGGPWYFSYKYPSKCSFLKRIKSCAEVDTSRTHIAKRTTMRDGQKVILTNEEEAIAEIIPKDISLEMLDYAAGLAISYMLAYLSAPLIVGKGAKTLREEIYQNYILHKAKAQEIDSLENFNFDRPDQRSEYVAARME